MIISRLHSPTHSKHISLPPDSWKKNPLPTQQSRMVGGLGETVGPPHITVELIVGSVMKHVTWPCTIPIQQRQTVQKESSG